MTDLLTFQKECFFTSKNEKWYDLHTKHPRKPLKIRQKKHVSLKYYKGGNKLLSSPNPHAINFSKKKDAIYEVQN